MKLTYKYKAVTNLLLGVLCAYSVCACDNAQRITPVNNTNTDNDQANTQYEPDPTDTGSDKPENQDKPGEQNNQNDQDNHGEQPDENNQETPNDQDTPSEQPDQDAPNGHDDTDTAAEQPDQDTVDEHDDADTPVNPSGGCHGEGCQGDHGCKAGYVWVGEYASNFVDTGGDPNYNCVPCTTIDWLAEWLRNGNRYCPGGDDLEDKGKDGYLDPQTEACPEHTYANDSFDDCICIYGVPPPPKEDCHPSSTRKKPLIINPKVNVVRRNNSTTQLLLKHKVRERKTNKR